METTERLSLPMIIPGQAQKELFHNEALQVIDIVLAAAVEQPPLNDPPANPAAGACYLVGDAPSGEWAAYAGSVASFGSAGWRFVAPVVGMTVSVKPTGAIATFGTTGWEIGSIRGSQLIIDGNQVVGPRAAAIADPSGGTTVDTEARTALEQILACLRHHGLIAS
jgi:hypothetical protein